MLSDVYYPTIDNTNVETLQYIVTDGSTFTDLQTRRHDLDGRGAGHSGMACRVTSTASSGKYKIVTDYVTDPGANTILMKVALDVDTRSKPRREPASSTSDSIRR